jgi:hypothetical protein
MVDGEPTARPAANFLEIDFDQIADRESRVDGAGAAPKRINQ